MKANRLYHAHSHAWVAILLFVFSIALTSCSKDEDPPLLDDKQMTSFVFLLTENPIDVNVIGLINEDEKTITVEMPVGTGLSGLIPSIEVSEGATVNPTTAQDFSNPVSYRVTGEDGSTATYTANVSVALSQRDILQIILDENPGNALGWDLPNTADLGNLDGVDTDISGNIISLSFVNSGLTKIVPEIGQLTNLTSLSFPVNQITSVPSELGLLTNLKNLNLHSNKLTSIPPEIGNLSKLEHLNLSKNLLTTLPQEIWQLTNLTSLFLYGNLLTSIPKEIENLSNLDHLLLNSNQLTSIPEEIFTLTNLHTLYLSNNQLTSISKEVGRLIKLKYLSLHNNQLPSIPPEIGFLSQLELLDIGGNNLIFIPFAICALQSFNGLSLSTDIQDLCTSTPSELDVLISFSSLNPDNTLGWGVDNFPEVEFNPDGSPRNITANNKNLVRIPFFVSRLFSLEGLNVSGNSFGSIPSSIGDISTLIILTLHDTDISTVPSSLGQLSNLALLTITDNPITSIPQSVCDLQISNGGNLTILADFGEGCD